MNKFNAMRPNLIGDQMGDDYYEGDSLLGDQMGDNASITLPSGETISLPMESVGDIFSGDDDESFGDSLLGDDEEGISNVGDIFSGDMSLSPIGRFLGKARNARTGAQKAAAGVMSQIPGAVLSTRSLSPLIINNGLINQVPTRALLQGAAFNETIRRYETQYPGTTRTYINTSASGTVTVFFSSDPTEIYGDNATFTQRVPVVFVQISVARQFTQSSAEIKLKLVGVGESGSPVDVRYWSVLLSESLDSCFFALIPFVEISSTIYPAIVSAFGAIAVPRLATNLEVEVNGLPTNSNLKIVLPGPDSTQYQYFKQGMGISRPTQGLVETTKQGSPVRGTLTNRPRRLGLRKR